MKSSPTEQDSLTGHIHPLPEAPVRLDCRVISTDPGPSSAAVAEEAVARFLVERGFDVVARNLRLGHLELDVVARRGPLIVVVEVRYRGPGAWTSGFGSIDRAKRRRVRRAGERLWQRRYRDDPSVERLRFDAASVTFENGRPVVCYAEAAF